MHNIRLLWLTYATTAMLLALMKKTRTPAIIIWMILAKIWGHVRAIVCLKKIQYIYIYMYKMKYQHHLVFLNILPVHL